MYSLDLRSLLEGCLPVLRLREDPTVVTRLGTRAITAQHDDPYFGYRSADFSSSLSEGVRGRGGGTGFGLVGRRCLRSGAEAVG